MRIKKSKQVEKFLLTLDKEAKTKYIELEKRLYNGEILDMPHSRKIQGSKGLYELRFNSDKNTYRVFYVIVVKDAIYMIQGCTKKEQVKVLSHVKKIAEELQR